MSGFYINRQDMERINKALGDYFEKKHSIADAVAAEWISLPEYMQVPLYELSVAYLERLAGEEHIYDPTLRGYHETAMKMIQAIQY